MQQNINFDDPNIRFGDIKVLFDVQTVTGYSPASNISTTTTEVSNPSTTLTPVPNVSTPLTPV